MEYGLREVISDILFASQKHEVISDFSKKSEFFSDFLRKRQKVIYNFTWVLCGDFIYLTKVKKSTV